MESCSAASIHFFASRAGAFQQQTAKDEYRQTYHINIKPDPANPARAEMDLVIRRFLILGLCGMRTILAYLRLGKHPKRLQGGLWNTFRALSEA